MRKAKKCENADVRMLSLFFFSLEMLCIPGLNEQEGIKIREKMFLTNAGGGKWLFNLLGAPVAVQAYLNSFINF